MLITLRASMVNPPANSSQASGIDLSWKMQALSLIQRYITPIKQLEPHYLRKRHCSLEL